MKRFPKQKSINVLGQNKESNRIRNHEQKIKQLQPVLKKNKKTNDELQEILENMKLTIIRN